MVMRFKSYEQVDLARGVIPLLFQFRNACRFKFHERSRVLDAEQSQGQESSWYVLVKNHYGRMRNLGRVVLLLSEEFVSRRP